jgi:hypothetical protein
MIPWKSAPRGRFFHAAAARIFWANEFVGVRSKVAFNDDQVKALKEFSAPIPYHLRDRFLQEPAHELRRCTDIPGDGGLFRAMRPARDRLPAAAMRFQG